MITIKLKNDVSFYVDDEDRSLVEGYNWYLHKTKWGNYIRGAKPRSKEKIYLHRLLLNPSKQQYVDHIDRNGLNNCRNNIRICTQSENLLNRNHKGYWFDKGCKRFRAETTLGRKKKYIGIYKTAEEARNAYLNYINKATDGFLNHVEA